ncbi:hypothetical protein K7X08_000109 [Anisodus acutangulus]|uniref:Transcription repressor n=1 Tax=Anisodus acutangulus TaxID=402998 RepID=A0A9Q1M597_9SOLA|nr:hypothetical protein K7X08_000109 [Anisodus acutangulus]
MGNYRFKLSDMVPNAWFYKLKDMGKIRSRIKRKQTSSSSLSSSSSSIFSSSSNLQQTKTQQPQRKSYYISRNLSPTSHHNNETLSKNPTSDNTNFTEPPRKSSNKRRNTTRRNTSTSPKCVNSTASSACSCRESVESVWTKNYSTPEEYPNSSSTTSFSESSFHSPKTFDAMILSSSCHCSHIVIDTNKNDHGFHSVSKIDLPSIITKPKKHEDSTNGTKKKEEKTDQKSLNVKIVKKEQSTSPKRRVAVKLRTKSPRIVNRKSVSSRRSVGESFAVVKSSKDPQRDFKESMVDMIVENNIRTSKDLEELLACYLSLNSDHYHDLIIKVFKQIWFDIQLK